MKDTEIASAYEPVIGLEVHIQLLTKSKAYSSDPTEYGALPNTNVSAISLGHPGTLPRANKKVIEFAVKLGLACKCEITEFNGYARKNYFYADLPKGYQITQDKTPICTGGKITIKVNDAEKDIHITRIHMEEDAGKSLHDQDPYDTLIDLNRAGVPLLEIVSEPDIRSSDEAYAYLSEVRKLVRYLDICDGNMEEGSLRCDANVSVRKKGEKAFGRRVEVKNMNSIRNVQRAIEFEIKRQVEEIEAGNIISQDTRSFDAETGSTFVMRSKEMANDYRYFPEPDLNPVIVTKEYIAAVKDVLPPLPAELFKKYTADYGLTPYDVGVITETKEIALYFEALTRHTKNYKSAANWVMGAIKSYLNEKAITIDRFTVAPIDVAGLIELIDNGKVSNTLASQKLFPEMIRTGRSAVSIAEEQNLLTESDTSALEGYIEQAIRKYPEKVAEYKGGKSGLLGLFMGEVMKLSKGKADPKTANEILRKKLDAL